MTLSIVGKINDGKIGFYAKAKSRKAEYNDVVFDGTDWHRLIWNHNGQRLTSVRITELVVAAWERSEVEADAKWLESAVRRALVEPLAAATAQRNAAMQAVQ